MNLVPLAHFIWLGRHLQPCSPEEPGAFQAYCDPAYLQHPCWLCGRPVTLAQRSAADGDCPHCHAELDLADWPLPKEST